MNDPIARELASYERRLEDMGFHPKSVGAYSRKLREFLEANPQEIDQVGMDMPKIGEALLEFYQQRGDEKALEKIRNILT